MQDPFQLVGRVLDGKYRLEGVLGEGGFGVVYAGRQIALDQPVAVKCLKPSTDGSDAAAFLREAKVLFGLSHPGIVRMYDVGEVATAHGALPYVVLERLEGQTLEDEIQQRAEARRFFSAGELGALAEGLLDALAFAHARGVVHRDIKPANVMVVRGPAGLVPKILDFGLARGGLQGAKSTANVGLTPRYAAPEQWNASYGPVGPLTDLFAVGLVLEEAATLIPALAGDSIAEVVAETTRPTRRSRLPERRPDLPPAFARAIDQATRVAPGERFHAATAMREALRASTSGASPQAPYGPHPPPLVGSSPLAVSQPGMLATSRPVSYGPAHEATVPHPSAPPPGAPYGQSPSPAPLMGALVGPAPGASRPAHVPPGPPPSSAGRWVVVTLVLGFFSLGALVIVGVAVVIVFLSRTKEAPAPAAVAPSSAPLAAASPSASPGPAGSPASPPGAAPAPSAPGRPAPVSPRPSGSVAPTPTAPPAPAPPAPPAPRGFGVTALGRENLYPSIPGFVSVVNTRAPGLERCFKKAGVGGEARSVLVRRTFRNDRSIGMMATMSHNGAVSKDAASEEIKDCVYADVRTWTWPTPGYADTDSGVAYIEFRAGY